MTPVRLGLIGAGRWGKKFLMTASSIPEVNISCVAARSGKIGLPLDPRTTISRSWEDMISSQKIDGVIVATPPQTHARMTIAAVELGIPVLVEKPLTLTLRDAEAISERVTRLSGSVMVDHTYLFHPAFERLQEVSLHRSSIRYIHSTFGNAGPYRKDTPPLWDYGAHDVAMCLSLVGQAPLSVGARRFNPNASRPQGEVVDVQLGFKGPVEARLRVGNGMEQKVRRFEVQGEDWAMIFDDFARDTLLEYGITNGVRHSRKAFVLSPEPPLSRVLKEFAQLVKSHQQHSSLSLGVEVVRSLGRAQRRMEHLQKPQ